jgi:hypothetical protein
MKQRLKKLTAYAIGKEHRTIRTVQLTKLSMMLNVVLAIGKIGLGVYSLSLFVCMSGFYNIGIAFAKHEAVKDRKNSYRRTGYIILVTSVVYLIYCANMAIRNKANISYDLITALTIATLTFSEIGLAVHGLLHARKSKDLTLMAAKRINLVTALISLVLTQSALLGLETVENAARYCGWTGLIFGGVSAMIGLSMAVSRKYRADELARNSC